MFKAGKYEVFRGRRICAVSALVLFALLCLGGRALAQAASDATEEDVLKSLTNTFGGITGIEIVTSLRKNGSAANDITMGVNGAAYAATDATTFRIGSQSKMFTGTILLNLINDDANYDLSLDSTVAEIVNANAAVKAKLPDNIIARAGNMKLRQLLNMGTDLPNNLSGVPKGQSQTLFELWQSSKAGGASGGYGSVSGFDAPNADAAHTAMAALSLDGEPDPPPGGLYTGIYSNSNAVILALIAEGLTGKSFDVLLEDWRSGTSLSTATKLPMFQGGANEPDLVGTYSGEKIVQLDPIIPWVSGAVISTMGDLMTAVEMFKGQGRMNSADTTVINMHSMPTYYGLGLLALDFDFISTQLWPEEVHLSPILATGHGGSIAGCSSFSGWLTASDSPLDMGLITYANVSNAYSRGGVYTETPSETLFVTIAEHLYRQSRADGTYNAGTGLVSYGANGGYATTASGLTPASLSFDKSAGSPPLIAYFDWDSLLPSSLAINVDPTFTHYSTASDNSAAPAAETVMTVSGAVDLPAWARMEGYSGDIQKSGSSYTLLELGAGTPADSLLGQVAVYGSLATALKAGREISLGRDSVIEAHGYDSTALELLSGANNEVGGKVHGAGAKITALKVGPGVGVTIGEKAMISGTSYGSANEGEDGFEGVTTDNFANGVTGLLLEGANSAATVKGWVSLQSSSPDSAISVGISLAGANAAAVVDGGLVESDGYAAHFKGAGTKVTLQNGAIMSGLIRGEASAAGSAFIADDKSLIMGPDYDQPIIAGVNRVILSGTAVAWETEELPELDKPISVVTGNNPALSSIKFRPLFDDEGLLAYSIDSQNRVIVNGLKAGAYKSPNARNIYGAWQEASKGTDYGKEFLGDMDNLSHEAFATLAGAALDAQRQIGSLARRFLFPDAGAARAGESPAAPAAGEAPEGLSRFVFEYFHTDSSRDDDGYSGYDQSGNGILTGAAFDLHENLALAAYVGWHKGETDFNYLKAESDADSMFAGLMGRWRQEIASNMEARYTAHLSYSRVENDLSRTVTGRSVRSRATGSFDQKLTGFGVEAALDWFPGDGDILLSPWLGLDYLHLDQDGLTEKAADEAPIALTTKGLKNNAVHSTVGLAASRAFKGDNGESSVTLKASAAWEHQYGDNQFTTEGAFVAGGRSFKAKSLETGRDAALLGLSAEAFRALDDKKSIGFKAGVDARLARGGHDLSFNVGIEYRF